MCIKQSICGKEVLALGGRNDHLRRTYIQSREKLLELLTADLSFSIYINQHQEQQRRQKNKKFIRKLVVWGSIHILFFEEKKQTVGRHRIGYIQNYGHKHQIFLFFFLLMNFLTSVTSSFHFTS